MAITLLDKVGVSSGGMAPTINATLPLGAPSVGDLLVVAGLRDALGPSDGITLAGWTELADVNANGRQLSMSWRIAQAGDPATFAFNYVSPAANAAGGICVLRLGGSWGPAPIPVGGDTNAAVGAAATHAVTPPAGSSAVIVSWIENYQLNSYAPVAGMTEDYDATDGVGNTRLFVGHRIIAKPAAGPYTVGANMSGGGFQDGVIRSVVFTEMEPAGKTQVLIF